MPLFRKPHGQLAWEDLRELIARETPENELLDYKARCPDRIEPTMAAMANTYGGDIVIGVGERDEKNDGRPVPITQVKGVAGGARLQQSIEQRNFSIHPPILGLHVEVVPIPQADHPEGRDDCALVVARIPGSDLVPHFVAGQGHFGRAGSHRRPYRDEQLTTARIEWLADRRQRHVEFRAELLEWLDYVQYSVAWHKVWCVPQYPSPTPQLWDCLPTELVKSIPRVRVATGSGLFLQSDFPEPISYRAVQHGALFTATRDEQVSVEHATRPGARWLSPALTYLVDDRGLLGMKSICKGEITALTKDVHGGTASDGVLIDWTTIAVQMIGITRHAADLYARHGYNGPVQFGMEIGLADDVAPLDLFLGMSFPPSPMRGPEGPPPVMWSNDVERLSAYPMATRQRRVIETHECSALDLHDKVRQVLCISRWARAFNYSMSQDDSCSYLEEIDAAFDSADPPC